MHFEHYLVNNRPRDPTLKLAFQQKNKYRGLNDSKRVLGYVVLERTRKIALGNYFPSSKPASLFNPRLRGLRFGPEYCVVDRARQEGPQSGLVFMVLGF